MEIRCFALIACLVTTLVQPLIPGNLAAAQSSAHRYAGHVFDPFVRVTNSGTFEAWTAEDGGRIRHRNPANGVWSFQSTPSSVKDTLHRIHFLPLGPFEQYGWAVGNNGWVLHTTNGGGAWSVIAQISSAYGPEELFDVHFLNDLEGWLVGKHSFLKTTDGGNSWFAVNMFLGGLPWGAGFQDEGYTIDIVERSPNARLGLIVTEPGFVFRSTDPALMTWDLVFALPDVLPNPQNYPCIQLTGCELSASRRFEPWDVEISRHPTNKLALFTGGRGFQCGLMFSSTDDGLTWCKEWHECTCSVPGCNTNCAGDPNYNPPATLYRHQRFSTLYGLAINSTNNSAIADGYGGQQLLRDPATGVWLDRSVFSALVPTPIGSVKFPYQGAAFAGPNAIGQTLAILAGMGGLLRESSNGGQSYAPALGPMPLASTTS